MESDINLHVVFVTAFIKKDNKFLLAKRSSNDAQAGGHWATPGGKVDNEIEENIIENTLKREIKEEVGLEIQDKVTYLGSSSFIRSSGHHVIRLDYIAEYKSGEAQPLEDQEEVKWFTIDELFQLIEENPHLSYFKPVFLKLKEHILNK